MALRRSSQEYTDWDHVDNRTDADWWSSDWSTDLWNDPAWEQAARQLSSTQPAQEESNATHEGGISMSGGLKTCEMSVIDGEQQSERNDGDRAENWVQNELTDGHNSWNNRIRDRNWTQDKLTGGLQHLEQKLVQTLHSEQVDGWSQHLEQKLAKRSSA